MKSEQAVLPNPCLEEEEEEEEEEEDFGTTWAMENGYKIWNMKCSESLQGKFTKNSRK
jgi:hypothetical protein